MSTPLIRVLGLVNLLLIGFGPVACQAPVAERIALGRTPDGRVSAVQWRSSLPDRLRADVTELSILYPGRHASKPGRLDDAATWIESRLRDAGLEPGADRYETGGVVFRNVIGEIPGSDPDRNPIIVIGAHYDTTPDTPGADDNASAVAVGLALAEYFVNRRRPATLRFVFFANEEGPSSGTRAMGSLIRAGRARAADDRIVAMLCLEMLGYYSDDPVSEQTVEVARQFGVEPPPQANFLAAVAIPESADLLSRVAADWSGDVSLLPVISPTRSGYAGRSDHASYWQVGYPAVMFTDTAELRNPHYHRPSDRADTLDYERMASAAESLSVVVNRLAADPPAPAAAPRGVVTLDIVANAGETVDVEYSDADWIEKRARLTSGQRTTIEAIRAMPIQINDRSFTVDPPTYIAARDLWSVNIRYTANTYTTVRYDADVAFGPATIRITDVKE